MVNMPAAYSELSHAVSASTSVVDPSIPVETAFQNAPSHRAIEGVKS